MVLREGLGLAAPFYVLSFDPLIVSVFWGELRRTWESVGRILPADVAVDVVCQFGWHVDTDEAYDKFLRGVREVEKGLPAARLHFLANTRDNQTAMEADGLSAVFCNHNAFVDERRIRLVRPGRRTHDALYLARLSPFKRHHLAKAIPSLYLIGRPRPGERAYGDGVLRDLPHAHRVEAVRYSRLTHHFSRAAVGLCLSRAEGAMYASIEYLLAGLPVVSTRSLGGRDVFFDPEFVTIADDTPESVWDSVQTLKNRGLSPQAIRKATIPRLQRHRERFDALINGILTERGGGPTFRWEEARHHKLGLRCNVPVKQFQRSNPLLIWARTRVG